MRPFFLALLLLVFFNFGYGSEAAYEAHVAMFRDRGPALLTSGLFVLALLYTATYGFNRTRGYILLHLLARGALELSEFGVAYISQAAAWYAVSLDNQFWIDVGFLAYLPFVSLAVSLHCLRMIDFNYPANDRVENATLTVLTCLLFVALARAVRIVF